MLIDIFNENFENVKAYKKYVIYIYSNRDFRDTLSKFIIDIIFLISSILFFIKLNIRIKNFLYKFSMNEDEQNIKICDMRQDLKV